jgi:hypothetical protein
MFLTATQFHQAKGIHAFCDFSESNGESESEREMQQVYKLTKTGTFDARRKLFEAQEL